MRGLLAAAGIAARVLNEYAAGGLGDLRPPWMAEVRKTQEQFFRPADAVRPEVWLEEDRDLPRARQIVDAYEQTTVSPGIIGCPACGEDSPRGFAICWKCLAPLPV